MAVDKHLADVVRREAEEHDAAVEEALKNVSAADVITYLRRRGYEVKLEGTCPGCGRVIDGPHFCPGKPMEVSDGGYWGR